MFHREYMHVSAFLYIDSLWKDTQEAGNPDYLWERDGEVGGMRERIGSEITFENYTMWMC